MATSMFRASEILDMAVRIEGPPKNGGGAPNPLSREEILAKFTVHNETATLETEGASHGRD